MVRAIDSQPSDRGSIRLGQKKDKINEKEKKQQAQAKNFSGWFRRSPGGFRLRRLCRGDRRHQLGHRMRQEELARQEVCRTLKELGSIFTSCYIRTRVFWIASAMQSPTNTASPTLISDAGMPSGWSRIKILKSLFSLDSKLLNTLQMSSSNGPEWHWDERPTWELRVLLAWPCCFWCCLEILW